MIIYFCQANANWAPKNNLQEAIINELTPLDGLLLEDNDQLYEYLEGVISRLNNCYPKCTPTQVTSFLSSSGQRIISIKPDRIGDESLILQFTLRLVNGTLDFEEGFTVTPMAVFTEEEVNHG